MPNAKNLRTPTSEEARAMQKKSAAKRSQNIKEKKLIREILEERLGKKDLNEICDNLIIRAKGDSKDFEVLQAALGQKPVDRVMLAEVDQETIDAVEKAVLEDEE